MRGVVAHDEGPLPELVQQRAATLDVDRRAGRGDEELSGLGRVRVAEHRRRDITLAATRMRPREL
jgi:hypothetical protein